MDPNLYTAAMEGNLDFLTQYSNSSSNSNSNSKSKSNPFALQFTPNNNSVLHVVAEFGHSRCVEVILRACPLLLRRENVHGDTPLHFAAVGGHEDVVESLIRFASEQNTIAAANHGGEGGGETVATERAAANDGGGETAASEITIAIGGVGGDGGGDDATTVRKREAANDGVGAAAVREMLKARNRDGDTPLHLAARLREPLPVVSKLTEADGELEYGPNKAGETPLYMVVERGSSVAVVSQLLGKCKSRAACGGPGGKTVMHAAVIDSSKDAILTMLLEWKQDLIKEQDTKGWTPLHFAAHHGNLEAVKKILDKDKSVAHVKANNDEGNTALHIATAIGDTLVMNEILQKFPDGWEMVNSKGRNILHIAADKERDVAINFIQGKPWVRRLMNRKDNEGNTPCHLLASKGKVGLHMYPGADMFALNNEKKTPLGILIQVQEAQRKDERDAVKTMQATHMAEMELRIEYLLTRRLSTQFEQLQNKVLEHMERRSLETRQVTDAVSGHQSVRESIEENTTPMVRSSPGANE